MISSETAKKQLRQEAELYGSDPDYDGLHQGRDGTKLRHDNVIAVLRDHGDLYGIKTLVDFGCGTALLLQSMSDHGHLPERYIGIDFLEERYSHVMNRANALDVKADFIVGENIAAVPSEVFNQVGAAVVAIGIMGYPGLQSLRSIREFVTQLRSCFRHGVITVPRHMPERLGEAEMARYDSDDVAEALGRRAFSYREIHTDTLVFW